MTFAITMRPETSLCFDLTTYWLVVDGDNVGLNLKGGQNEVGFS